MRLTTHADPQSFLVAAEPLLAADEPRHNLQYAIVGRLCDAADTYPGFRLWTVDDDAATLAALLWTPPWNVMVVQPRDVRALDFAAVELMRQGARPPGVLGAVPEVHTFAQAWERELGVRTRVRMGQGIYAARSTRIPKDVPGTMRFATAADRELLIRWIRDFQAEALPEAPDQDHEAMFDRRIASETDGFAFWDVDGTSASFSGYGGPTPHGIRIGPVYTPPELRRRGYAGALVAQLTQHLLGSGRDYCFLYTDLANPTSNHIYTDVGYELACESVDYAFDY